MSNPEYLSVDEFSARCGLSAVTVRRYVASGKLPSRQPGGRKHRVLIPAGALDQIPTKPIAAANPDPNPTATKPTSGPTPRWQRGPKTQ